MFKVKLFVQVQVEKEDIVNDEISILIGAIFLFQDRLKTLKKIRYLPRMNVINKLNETFFFPQLGYSIQYLSLG